MGLFDKFIGSDDPETLLEEKHDMTPSGLFVEDRNGDTKYNRNILIEPEIQDNVAQWRDNETTELISSRFQDNIQIEGNRMEIDWDSTEELYHEIVGPDENVEYLSEDQEIQKNAQSAYKASAGFEKAVRNSIHSRMDDIHYQSGEGDTQTITPVPATVPGAMHGFTEKLDQESAPEGWSVGHATAVADRYHVMKSLKKQLEHESGSSTEAIMERASNGEDVEGLVDEAFGEDEYVQHKLEQYGFAEDEVRSEYSIGL